MIASHLDMTLRASFAASGNKFFSDLSAQELWRHVVLVEADFNVFAQVYVRLHADKIETLYVEQRRKDHNLLSGFLENSMSKMVKLQTIVAPVCTVFHGLSFVHHLPSLSTIVLHDAPRLDEFAVLWTFKGEPKVSIQYLCLRGMRSLSAEGAELIAQNCPNLTHYNIASTVDMCHVCVHDIVQDCKKLTWFDFTANTAFIDDIVTEVKRTQKA